MPYMRVETGLEEGTPEFAAGQFDENGYPVSLKPGQKINLGFGSGTEYAWPEGKYHVFYEGQGTLMPKTACEKLIQDYGNGHQVWAISHDSPWFGFSMAIELIRA